jgi:hypothetical protein
VVATTYDGQVRARDVNDQGVAVIHARPDAVLAAFNAAYGDMRIEVKLWDPPHGQVGNKNFSKMYRLGGAPLSTYFGCGTTLTGAAADSYRVTISLVSQVTPVADGSETRTLVTGFADDLGSSKGAITCESLGTLERRLSELAQKHLKD